MSGTDWRVYACIAVHADASGRAYPGMTTIAGMTGIRRQDVPRVIRRLERLQQLRCEPGAGPGGANVYVLEFDQPEVSATLRTVRNAADPQGCGGGVRNAATKVSARLRTKHTKEQTNEHMRTEDEETAGQFETFWRNFPKRGEHNNPKKPAREKYLAAVKRGVDPALMNAAAANYGSFIARSGTRAAHVKQAVSWLHQECWEQYGAFQEPEPLRAGMI
jgi:hypothetical protein